MKEAPGNVDWSRYARERLSEDFPYSSYVGPLETAIEGLGRNIEKVPTCTPVIEQLLQFLELAPYLPSQILDRLLIESTVPSLVTDKDLKYSQTESGTGVLVHPEIDTKTALGYAETFDWYRSSVLLTNGFDYKRRQKDIRNLPAGILTDTREERGGLFEKLLKTQLIIVPINYFFQRTPGGEKLIKPKYGDSFWVQDCPLNNILIVSGIGLQNLKELGEAAILSHVSHELLGHIAISSALPLQIKREKDLFSLDGNFHPVFFTEGLSNILSLRYLSATNDDRGFLKLIRSTSSLPPAEEILSANNDTPYLFFTLFNGFLLEYMIKQNESMTVDPLVSLYLPDMFEGIRVLRHVMNEYCYNLDKSTPPPPHQDITLEALRLFYNRACQVIRERYPIKRFIKPVADFDTALDTYNRRRQEYLELWKQKIAGRTPEPSISTPYLVEDSSGKPQWDKNKLDQKLIGEIDLLYEKLSQLKNSKAQLLEKQILFLATLSSHLNESSLYRILAEGNMMLYLDKSSKNYSNLGEILRHKFHQLFQDFMFGGADLLPADIDLDWPEESSVLYSARDLPIVGKIFFNDEDIQSFLGRILLAHYSAFSSFESRRSLNLRKKYFNEEPLLRPLASVEPLERDYYISLIELLSIVTGLTIPDLKQTIVDTGYIYMPIEEYYKQFPVLQQIDHKMFLVRELPLSGVIVYTDRAKDFFTSNMFLSQNVRHEIIHLLLEKILPIKIATEKGEVSLSPSLCLPIWFWEGIANTLSHRFQITPGFWQELTKQIPGWRQKFPSVEEILSSKLDFPIIYSTLFTTFLFLTIYEAKLQSETNKFDLSKIKVNMNTFVPGFFEFLKAAKEMGPINLSNDDKLLGQFWIESIYERLQQKYIQLPNFKEICQWFDENKDRWVIQWESSAVNNTYTKKIESVIFEDKLALEEIQDILNRQSRLSNWASLPQLLAFGTDLPLNWSISPIQRQIFIYRNGVAKSLVVIQRDPANGLGIARIMFPDLKQIKQDPDLLETIRRKFAPDMIIAQFTDPDKVSEHLNITGRYAGYEETAYSTGWINRVFDKDFKLSEGSFLPNQINRIKEYLETVNFSQRFEGSLVYIPYWELLKKAYEKKGLEGVEYWYENILSFYQLWQRQTGLIPTNDLRLLNLFGKFSTEEETDPKINGAVIIDKFTGAVVGINIFALHPDPNYAVSIINKVLRIQYPHLGVFNIFRQVNQISNNYPDVKFVLHGGRTGSRPGQQTFKAGFGGQIIRHTSVVLEINNQNYLTDCGFGINDERTKTLINGIWLPDFSSW